jgi:hypothetical protein
MAPDERCENFLGATVSGEATRAADPRDPADGLQNNEDHAQAMAREIEQLRYALESRDIIGQAKGMIMERFQLDAARAFELMIRVSQNSNIRVADLAEEIASRRSEPKSLI